MNKLLIFIIPAVLFGHGNPNSSEKLIHFTSNNSIGSDSIIMWTQNTPLKWSDFQAKPDTLSTYRAMTFFQIGLKFEESENSYTLDIPTYFYKKLSWTKTQSNIQLLKHEQLHFDMAELMARKIRREFSLFQVNKSDSVLYDLKKIYTKYYGPTLDEYNAKYDKETNHGTIKTKQTEWELKIKNELKTLQKYTSSKVIIKKN